jgi:hypothetical protein
MMSESSVLLAGTNLDVSGMIEKQKERVAIHKNKKEEEEEEKEDITIRSYRERRKETKVG